MYNYYNITWTLTNDFHKLSDTQSILMYHSVAKVKKIGLRFSQLNFKYNMVRARLVQVMPMQYFTATH